MEGVKFRDCVEDNFFTQYVNSPTRDGNILDLVLCNEPDMIGNLEVIAGAYAEQRYRYRRRRIPFLASAAAASPAWVESIGGGRV